MTLIPEKDWPIAEGIVISDHPGTGENPMIVRQDGIDWSEFLEKGMLFDSSGIKTLETAVGMPLSFEHVQVDGYNATKVRFRIRPHRVDDLKATPGVSITGQTKAKVVETQGNIFEQTKILDVFLTDSPTDPYARLEMVARSWDEEGECST
jgi:hypothetical protein